MLWSTKFSHRIDIRFFSSKLSGTSRTTMWVSDEEAEKDGSLFNSALRKAFISKRSDESICLIKITEN